MTAFPLALETPPPGGAIWRYRVNIVINDYVGYGAYHRIFINWNIKKNYNYKLWKQIGWRIFFKETCVSWCVSYLEVLRYDMFVILSRPFSCHRCWINTYRKLHHVNNSARFHLPVNVLLLWRPIRTGALIQIWKNESTNQKAVCMGAVVWECLSVMRESWMEKRELWVSGAL